MKTTITGEGSLIKKTASKELELNIKHQIGKIDEVIAVGYEFDKGECVAIIIIPNLIKSKSVFKSKKGFGRSYGYGEEK